MEIPPQIKSAPIGTPLMTYLKMFEEGTLSESGLAAVLAKHTEYWIPRLNLESRKDLQIMSAFYR